MFYFLFKVDYVFQISVFLRYMQRKQLFRRKQSICLPLNNSSISWMNNISLKLDFKGLTG